MLTDSLLLHIILTVSHDCVYVANALIVLILTSANSLHADPDIFFSHRRHPSCDCGAINCDCLHPRWRNIQLCTWRLVSELSIFHFKLRWPNTVCARFTDSVSDAIKRALGLWYANTAVDKVIPQFHMKWVIKLSFGPK